MTRFVLVLSLIVLVLLYTHVIGDSPVTGLYTSIIDLIL